jgi:energy-coupling factor transporter ATP-binding protein EcfA2
MVFQRPVLLRRSVAANLDYPLKLRGLSRADRGAETVARTLDRFGLTPLADRPARLLSGGEQQRLALARAWAMRPEVLFLDEPSSALDPSATRIIEEMIEGFSAEGITIVMTTHNLGQARRLAEDVAFLHRGRLIEHARPHPSSRGPNPRGPRLPCGRSDLVTNGRDTMTIHLRTRSSASHRAWPSSRLPAAAQEFITVASTTSTEQLGPVRPHPADVRGGDRDRGARRGAGHRPGAGDRPPRRRRRRLRPCPRAGGGSSWPKATASSAST